MIKWRNVLPVNMRELFEQPPAHCVLLGQGHLDANFGLTQILPYRQITYNYTNKLTSRIQF